MRTNFLKLSLLALVIFTTSCSNDDKKEELVPAVITQKFTNLPAPATGGQGQPEGGAFTKFSFSENKIVTNDNWDVAFRGTVIIVNGGAKIGIVDEPNRTGNAAVSIVSGAFSTIKSIPLASTFKQDGAAIYAFPKSGDNAWYDYNSNTHIISSKAGKIFVIKTHDGKYAKFEILSYYKDAPAAPDLTSTGRYYTFNFAYQPNSTTTF
ncbi:HmuY family protein [Flavobacterium sp. GP15]|uniref:HmuY family protein n=1 Tax=Flavobacterium sp. GP15 TaxID=2758567 RepID=UPI00165D4B85|nr:HmuY family protein [Flavobacterium sp. GP15]